jgi:hypothetical protein
MFSDKSKSAIADATKCLGERLPTLPVGNSKNGIRKKDSLEENNEK